MKKRNESSIVTAILKYLQCLENNGKIVWCDRMNSGKVFLNAPHLPGNASRLRQRMIRGHRAGTPDIMAVLRTGSVLWIEAKSDTGKQTLEQYNFESMIKNVPNHRYFIVRCVDDVAKILGTV